MDIDMLINKVLIGKASEEEIQELNAWIGKDVRNKSEFEDIKLLYQPSAETGNQSEETDFYKGLDKIKSTIDLLEDKNRRIRILKIYGVVITVICFTTIIFSFFRGCVPQAKSPSDLVIHPDINGKTKFMDSSLRFERATVEHILGRLETEFGAEFEIENKDILSCRFTGIFYKGSTIEDVLRTLKNTIRLNYAVLDSGRYRLAASECSGLVGRDK